MTVASHAPEQATERRSFYIRPQPLTSALIHFSKQSNRQIVVASRIVPQRTTRGVRGSMSIERALEELLAGSGLTFSLEGERTVRIVEAKERESEVAEPLPSLASERWVPPESVPSTSMLLSEVLVTARRIQESAQDVPIVVNVFTPEVMASQDVRTFTDLERMVPAVSTCCSRHTISAFTYIRGVNNAIGYFAEVPTPLNGTALHFDIANVQVLKGPQGTLFGIATNGGAILYEPRRPSNRLEGHAAITAGSRDRATVEAVLNLPVSDSLSIRVGGVVHRADGYVRNVTAGTYMGDENYWIGRLAVSYRPSPSFTNISILNVYRSDRVPEPLGIPYGENAGINPAGSVEAVFGGPELDAWKEHQLSLGRYAIVGTSVENGPRQKNNQINFINTTSYDISPTMRLRNIVGFVQERTISIGDTDSTPFRIFETSFPTEFPGPTRQYSEELQLQGTGLGGSLTYVVGTFNRITKQDEPATTYAYSLGVRSGTRSRAEGSTSSVFAEGSYSLSNWLEGLQFTAGYRFTYDSREAAQVRFDAEGNEIFRFDAAYAWQRSSYRWGVSYAPIPQVMLYFMNSRGYSAGGFNLVAPSSAQRYDPETLDNYELGMKAEWHLFGRPIRTNVSAYYGDWDRMQAQVTSRCETPTGIVFCQLTRNAATGLIYGVEGEFTFKPKNWMSISGNVAYMRGKYREFFGSTPSGECCVDLSHAPFLYVPRWKYSLIARADLPIDPAFGQVDLAVTYSYTDDIHSIFTLGPPAHWTTSPPMENVNLTLNWREVLGISGLGLAAMVTNLTQNTNLQGQWGVYETLGQYGRGVAVPRSWALRLRYDF